MKTLTRYYFYFNITAEELNRNIFSPVLYYSAVCNSLRLVKIKGTINQNMFRQLFPFNVVFKFYHFFALFFFIHTITCLKHKVIIQANENANTLL